MGFHLDNYPPNWRTEIVPAVRARSGNRCECTGECGRRECQGRRCPAVHGQPHPLSTSPRGVVLTTAHLNHMPSCADIGQLRHLCERCHLYLDRDHHARNARATLRRRRLEAATEAGQVELALGEVE